MKKLSLPLTVLLLVGLGYLLWSQRGSRSDALQPASLLPAETVMLAELPDVVASRERWKTTALAAILAEPEVRAFLERPLSPLAEKADSSGFLEAFLQVKPRQAFISVVDFENKIPTIAAGFRFAGSRKDLESFLVPRKEALLKKFPTATQDIEQVDGEVVETITGADFSYAEVVVGDLYLMASDVTILKSLLAGVKGRGPEKEKTLAATEAYQQAMAKLPGGAHEVTLFLEPSSLVERLVAVSSASGHPMEPDSLKALKSVRALSAATAFEAENIRDTIFILSDQIHDAQPLADSVMRYTSPQTMLFYAGLFQLPATLELPDGSIDKTGMIEVAKVILQQMESRDLGMDQLSKAFGPRINFQLEWPEIAPQPTALISMDVSDSEVAGRFVKELVTGELGLPPMTELDADGTTVYSLASMGRVPVSPSLALTKSSLLIGLDPGQVADAIKRQEDGATLATSETFAASRSAVCDPTKSLVYVDSRALFERVYGTFRPFLMMGAAFMPSKGPVDLAKLPTTEVVSRHLGPIVFSQSSREDGVLCESVGPLTLNQLILIGGAGMGGAAVKKQLGIE